MDQIDFINASLWYGEVIALNEISFKITPGITGLVGSNGAGKTSSIKLATSLMKPTLGEVNFNGDPVWQNYEYLRQLGYSPEIDRQFNFMTGRKFLEFAFFSKFTFSERNQKQKKKDHETNVSTSNSDNF